MRGFHSDKAVIDRLGRRSRFGRPAAAATAFAVLVSMVTTPGAVATPRHSPTTATVQSAVSAFGGSGDVASLDPATTESWTPTTHTVSDGEKTTVEVFAQPVFRRDGDGWTQVDPTITPGSGPYAFEALGLVNPVHFGTDAAALVTIDTLAGPVRLGLEGATVSTPVLDDNGMVTYTGVFPGVDLKFSTEGGRLGKYLVLADREAPTSFTFTMGDPEKALGTPTRLARDAWAFDGQVAFGAGLRLPAPAAWESTAERAAGVWGSAHQALVATDGGYEIELSVDADWVAGVEYPIVLDPAVEWTDETWEAGLGLEVAHAPIGVQTCDGGPCELMAPINGYVGIGNLWDEPDLGHYLTYVGADFSALAGRRIASAKLAGDDYNVYPRVNDICARMDGGSTGVDLAAAVCGEPKPVVPTYLSRAGEAVAADHVDAWFADVTDSIVAAVAGTGPTGHFAGFAIGRDRSYGPWEPPPDPDLPDDFGAIINVPYLSLTYAGFPVPRPLMLGQTFGCDCWAGGSTGNQARAADPVNTATGGYIEQFVDLAIAGVGQSIALTRTYNSLDNRTGPFGRGWSFAYGATLLPDVDGNLVFSDGSGTQSRFGALLEGGYAPIDPAVSAELTDGPDDSHVMRNLSGSTMSFDAEGRLIRLADERRQGLSFGYADGRLTTITDEVGQTLTLTWDVDDEARIASATSSDGRSVGYGYDEVAGAKRLVEVTAVDGATTHFDYDQATGAISEITDPLGNIRMHNVYDPQTLRVLSQTDALGAVTTFGWDPETQTATVTDPTGAVRVDVYHGRNLVKQVDPTGAVTETLYDADNNPSAFADAAGNLWIRDYDDRDRLVRTVSPVGATSWWEYDDADRLIASTDGVGRTTWFDYDANGLLIDLWAPDGGNTHNTYTTGMDGAPANLLATATDPLGRTTTYVHDATGDLVSTTDAAGNTTSFVYDAAHRLTQVTDPTGSTTSFTYDEAGRLLTSTDPLGAVTINEYDAAGQLTRTTAADGTWVTYTYDAAGRVMRTEDSGGATIDTVYDLAGRVVSLTDALGAATKFTYDAAGRLTAETDPLGLTTAFGYDAVGRLTTVITPSGATTSYRYDRAGRQTSTIDPLGAVTKTGYDAANRPTEVQDPDGRTVRTAYDAMGRVFQVTRADWTWLSWSYDQAGQLTSYTDAARNTTDYEYDEAGLRSARTDSAGRVTTYGHDGAGRLTTVIAPDTTLSHRSYDAAGRLIGIDYDDATPDVSFTYDSVGRRTSMVDGSGTTTYSYDAAGRIVSSANAVGTVGYQWDIVGRLTALTYPDESTVERSYDLAGHLTEIRDWTDEVYQLSYAEDGQLEEIVFPNGVHTSYDHDAAGRTTSIVSAAEVLLDLAYSYDDSGLLTSQDTTRGQSTASSSYAWDDLTRLDEVLGFGAGDVAFTKANQVAVLPNGTYLAYDVAGGLATRMSDDQVTAYQYDGRGNRVAEEAVASTRSLVYDAADRLVGLTEANGTDYVYAYDGDGLRVEATTSTVGGGDSATEQYVWDTSGGVPLLLDDSGHNYLYAIGTVPVAQRDSTTGDVDYLHADLIGSVRSVTDQDGSVVAASDYAPYGVPAEVDGLAPVSTVSRFGYAGEYTDPTGYVYLRNRYYDPATAQFLTIDPLVDVTQDAYGYTSGNPLQYTDPLGLFDWGGFARDVLEGAIGVGQGIAQTITRPITAAVSLPQRVVGLWTAYEDGGLLLAVNQFNPVYSLLVNASTGWDLANQGCVRESARAFTGATFDAVDTAAIAAGGAGLARLTAGPAPVGLRGIDDVLGSLPKGRQSFVRTVPDEASLTGLFDELTQGGTPTTWKNFGGTVIDRGDAQVGLRSYSRSGGSAIDIRLPDGNYYRIHVEP